MTSRRVGRAGDLLRIEQTVDVRASQDGVDVLGPYWMLALLDVERGSVAYMTGTDVVRLPWTTFAVFAPPTSILQARLVRCRVATRAVASAANLHAGPREAVAWEVDADTLLPTTTAGVERMLEARQDDVAIGRDVARGGLGLRTKRRLDADVSAELTLQEIARQLRSSPAAASRAFRRSYGMPPLEYRHRVRTLAAVMNLTAGTPILAALAEAGFGDVSQSYRRFRSLLCDTPGAYARSRIAKT